MTELREICPINFFADKNTEIVVKNKDFDIKKMQKWNWSSTKKQNIVKNCAHNFPKPYTYSKYYII